MKLNEHQARMLRAACSNPVTLRQFTEGSVTMAISPRHLARYFEQLFTAGYIYQGVSQQFFATTKGRDYIQQKDRIEQAALQRSPSGEFKGTRWNVRAGGEDHKNHLSRGF